MWIVAKYDKKKANFFLEDLKKKLKDKVVIYNPRVMSLLGVVPFLHLIIFAIFKGNQIKTYSIIFIILQSIILAWVYNMRFTILWMYIFFQMVDFTLVYQTFNASFF